MRYVVEIVLPILKLESYTVVKQVLLRRGVQLPDALPRGGEPVKIRLEKGDPRLEAIIKDLEAIGHLPVSVYVPTFEPWELDAAELVILRLYGFCGDGFRSWARRLGLAEGTRVMDKRDMGKRDIAITYAHKEYVISERVKEILEVEGLTGWIAEPIRHKSPRTDRYPGLYELLSSHKLPPLAPETELFLDTHEGLPETDSLHGTTALFERGPLTYRRADLKDTADVCRTHEVFLEVTVAHSYLLFSQNAQQAFLKHKVRGDFEFEPIVILETP